MSEKVFILFFDAKMITYTQRKQCASFVKEIKRNGFSLLQKSVYIKNCVDNTTQKVQIERIKTITPPNVKVVLLSISVLALQKGGYLNCSIPFFYKNRTIICI